MRRPPRKATQKSATDGAFLFAKPEDWDRLEGRVLDLVMRGHTVGAAEKIAAAELLKGERC